MNLNRFLMYVRFSRERPKEVAANRWKAMLLHYDALKGEDTNPGIKNANHTGTIPRDANLPQVRNDTLGPTVP